MNKTNKLIKITITHKIIIIYFFLVNYPFKCVFCSKQWIVSLQLDRRMTPLRKDL